MTLATIAKSLRPGESYRITIQADDKGEIKMSLTPDFGATPTDATDEEVRLRSALSVPLSASGQPDETERLLVERLQNYRPTLDAGSDTLNDIKAMAEQAKAAAKAAKDKKAASATTTKTASASTAPEKKKTKAEMVEDGPMPTANKAPSLDNF